MFFAILLALLLLLAGTVILLASRHAGTRVDEGGDADQLTAPERFAVRMVDGVGRTAQAVDVLVDRRTSEEVLRHRESDPGERRQVFVVTGTGLLGLGIVMVLGVVLLLV